MEKTNLLIRRMNQKDVEVVYQIGTIARELEAFVGGGWYSKSRLRGWVRDERTLALVAETDKQVLGFIFATFDLNRASAYLEEMAVKEGFRGTGIGSKLFGVCLEKLREQGISYFYGLVQEENKNMVKFLENRGFKRGHKFYWMEKKT